MQLVRRDLSGLAAQFQVIDIKAVRNARAFQKKQVAFYALLVETILKENGVAGRVDLEGEIWGIPGDGGLSARALSPPRNRDIG